jgi:hypothetical protein
LHARSNLGRGPSAARLEVGAIVPAAAAHARSDNGPPYRLPAVLDRLVHVRASVNGNHGPSHAGPNAGGGVRAAPFERGALSLLAHASLDNWPAHLLPAVLDRTLEVGAAVGHRVVHAGAHPWSSLETAEFERGSFALRVQACLNDPPTYRIAAAFNRSIERRGACRLGGKQHEADDGQEQRCIPVRSLHEDLPA